jgi:hypothetical protein
MASIKVRKKDDTTEYLPLPPDTYLMRIKDADITLSSFKDKDGNDQHQLALTWEISRLTAEQKEDGVDESRWVRQWLSLYYGETKNGPSKLKEFLDILQAQGLVPEFDPADDEIDSDWFLGIEQRVTLAVKGSYNNVVMIAAPRTPRKNAPQPVKPEDAKPPKRRPAPPPPEDDEEEDEEGIF